MVSAVGTLMAHHHEDGDSDFECESDTSEDDPTYDMLEDMQGALSALSVKTTKSLRETKISCSSDDERGDIAEKNDLSFDNIQKIIEAGELERLKVDQCKVYLRKHGLRLCGKKDVLIARIREHLWILSGSMEKKYPVSSFVVNCKGDACKGDVVMFEQNVYEIYPGPPCGTRTVVGRIVRESYGAAKQQHTFTIEVLGCKGVKPLPPLHPLLIKGRNLYKLNTKRQRWPDEDERRKVLLEKHKRGDVARCSRESRLQEKEMRKHIMKQREQSKISRKTKGDGQRYVPPPLIPDKYIQKQIDNQQLYELPIESHVKERESCNRNVAGSFTLPISQSISAASSYNVTLPPPQSTNGHAAQSLLQRLDGDQKPISAVPLLSQNHHFPDHISSNRKPLGSFNFYFPPSSNYNGPMKLEKCHYYQQGRCYYGYACRWLHEKGG